MNVQVYTSVVNRPEFLGYQARLFSKYLARPYSFHVVDDSIERAMTMRFRDICDAHGLQYHRKPERYRLRNPSGATAAAIQWTFDSLIRPCHGADCVLFLDSDMFLLEPFDIAEYIVGYTLGGLPHKRGHIVYMWNGLMFFNMPELMKLGGDLDFSDGKIDGIDVDTGGYLYYFIHRAGVKLRETDPNFEPRYPTHYNGISLRDPTLTQGYDMELHCDGRFLHYRAASQWFGKWRQSKDQQTAKTRILEQIIDDHLRPYAKESNSWRQ